MCVSLSMAYLIVGIDKEIYGFHYKHNWINSIVIVSTEKTGNTSTGTTMNAKSLFKMLNMHYKIQIILYRIQSFLLYNIFICLTACWHACLPAIRPSSTMARVPVFHAIKVIVLDL